MQSKQGTVNRARDALASGRVTDKRLIAIYQAIVVLQDAQTDIAKRLRNVAYAMPSETLLLSEMGKVNNQLISRIRRLYAFARIMQRDGIIIGQYDLESKIMLDYQNSILADPDEDDRERLIGSDRELEDIYG